METSNRYDYKPLHLKFYDVDSVEVKALSIDGTTYDATIGLGEEWLKKIDGASTFKIFCRVEDKLLYQSDLTVEQLDELTRITEELTEEAKAMVKDYTDNPSEYNGEIDVDKNLVKGDGVVIHSNSPVLDEDEDGS
tara:strand:+ start:210 stop:617 length:408 start_codon:yes stop_codon:yes gene_type:complete